MSLRFSESRSLGLTILLLVVAMMAWVLALGVGEAAPCPPTGPAVSCDKSDVPTGHCDVYVGAAGKFFCYDDPCIPSPTACLP